MRSILLGARDDSGRGRDVRREDIFLSLCNRDKWDAINLIGFSRTVSSYLLYFLLEGLQRKWNNKANTQGIRNDTLLGKLAVLFWQSANTTIFRSLSGDNRLKSKREYAG